MAARADHVWRIRHSRFARNRNKERRCLVAIMAKKMDRMTDKARNPWTACRRRIENLGPYSSLALLGVPVCIVEPLKLIAVAVAGEGHWFTGTFMIVAAYATSLFLIERLFAVVKPKLLKLRWFAKIWAWVIVWRYKILRPMPGA